VEILLHVEMILKGRVNYYYFVLFRRIILSHLLKLLAVHMLTQDVDASMIDSEVFFVDDSLVVYRNVGNRFNRADVCVFVDLIDSF
jgi:hypothetical protein